MWGHLQYCNAESCSTTLARLPSQKSETPGDQWEESDTEDIFSKGQKTSIPDWKSQATFQETEPEKVKHFKELVLEEIN